MSRYPGNYVVTFKWYSKVFKPRTGFYNKDINYGHWVDAGTVFVGEHQDCVEYILWNVGEIISTLSKFRQVESFEISLDSFLYSESGNELSFWIDAPYENPDADIFDYRMYTESLWQIHKLGPEKTLIECP